MHRRYNPEGITQYNIVPGLMGVILTMTMVMMTALAVTRERERGTMENLLAMPVPPLEVMIGKIVPYMLVGYVQVTIILLAAHHALRRADPRQRSTLLIALSLLLHRRQPRGRLHLLDGRPEPAAGDADDVLLLPAVDPAVGLHVSVPRHAATGRSGSARCCRSPISCASSAASLLKGNGFADMRIDVAALAIFMFVAMGLALLRFRKTLD